VIELQRNRLVAKVLELQRNRLVAKVLELHSHGLVAKVLEPSAMVLPKAMVEKKFPSVVVTDDLKLAVIMEVLTVVILVI
jgi:hypothetical protein